MALSILQDITEFGSLIVECNFFCLCKSMSTTVCLAPTKHNFVIVVIHEECFYNLTRSHRTLSD